MVGALASCLAREEAHAAGALAAGSSDSQLRTFLGSLAGSDEPIPKTGVLTSYGPNDATIDRKPAAHADDTGTGISRPPHAQLETRAAEVLPRSSVNPDARFVVPQRPNANLWVAGVAALSLAVLALLAALLIRRNWQGGDQLDGDEALRVGAAQQSERPPTPLSERPSRLQGDATFRNALHMEFVRVPAGKS